MVKRFFLSLGVLFSCGTLLSYAGNFTHEQMYDGWLLNQHKIRYVVHGQEVGFISYTKIPLVPFYALHSFYVYPSLRGKGYGTELLQYACEYLASIGATKIYLQPGPFELDKDGSLVKVTESHEERLQALIALYQKHGFAFVNSAVSFGARMLYACMGIDENAHYLMVKVLKRS